MSSRRTKSKDPRLDSLKALREARENTGSRLDQYKVNDKNVAVYDLVDEEDYENIRRKRMEQDDFVVDDDGIGYADYGQEEWDNGHHNNQYDTDDEDNNNDDDDDDASGRGKKKRKRNQDKKITSMLAKKDPNNLASSTSKKKSSKDNNNNNGFVMVDNTSNEQDLLDSIISGLDAELSHATKKVKPDGVVDNNTMTTSSSSNNAVFKKPKMITSASSYLFNSSDNNNTTNSTRNDDRYSLENTLMDHGNDELTFTPMETGFGYNHCDFGDIQEENSTFVESGRHDDSGNDDHESSVLKLKREPKIKQEEDDDSLEAVLRKTEKLKKNNVKEQKESTRVEIDEEKELILINDDPNYAPAVKVSAIKTAKKQKKAATASSTSKLLPKFETNIKTEVADDNASSSSQPTNLLANTDSFTSSLSGTHDILNEDNSISMFWFDAQESQGVVYLFGKVLNKKDNNYISCLVSVHNSQRNVFLLPRKNWIDDQGNETDELVEETDVYHEFDELRRKYGITSFSSTFVKRNYAFELPNVPVEAEYMKLVYSFKQPALPANLSGKTFSMAFGTNTNALELFVLKRKLMGPCWITIENPETSHQNVSWCRCEISVQDPKNIKVYNTDENGHKAPPPLSTMSLSLKTVMNHQKHVNEIVSASILVYSNVNPDGSNNEDAPLAYQHTLVRQLNDIPVPVGFYDLAKRSRIKLEIMKNERALLNNLLALMQRIDPDVLVGHNFIGFTLDVLLHRMKANKVDNSWSRLGRLRRTKWPRLQPGAGGMGESTFDEKQIVGGRLMCDTYLASRDLIKSKNYSLAELSSSQLKINRSELDNDKIPSMFWDAQDLLNLIEHNQMDAFLSMSLMMKLQVLPLTKQLTNLAGNLWSRTLTGARAERNEYLLLHEFHRAKFIVPDKAQLGGKNNINNNHQDTFNAMDDDDDGATTRKKTSSGRRKPAYSGGLVLEPKKGFYDKYVLLLDFNSLYPSIIQEFNICFTTVERSNDTSEEEKVPNLPDASLPQGILPKLLANLVNRRRQVKNLMKDPKLSDGERQQYDNRQKALKLTANSMYGCLGFSNSRFFAKPIAILITAKGRETLQTTVDMAIEQKLDVIYGDTDSIMIYTNSDNMPEVKKIGNEFKNLVNKRYKLLEIEMDGMFQRMLLLRKKKYAALVVEEKKDGRVETFMETKGLEEVRRDWCALSKEVSHFILTQLFSGANREDVVQRIHEHLTTIGQSVRSGAFPVSKYVIYKGLTKAPEDYADKRTQSHVQVALALKAKGASVRIHDTIPYVICQGKEDLIASRAFHPDDVTKDNLLIDFEWYLSTQILPPVTRLIGPIDETDSGRVAECLGLDARKYTSSVVPNDALALDDQMQTLDSQISDEERFRHVEKWQVCCSSCDHKFEFESCFTIKGTKITSNLLCPNESCNLPLSLASLQTQLMLAIRQHIKRYGQFVLVCDDSACHTRTTQMSVYGRKCLNRGCRGQMRLEYNDKMLSTQLIYFQYLFDTEKLASKNEIYSEGIKKMAFQHSHVLEPLQDTVQFYMQKNARNHVDLNQVFSFITA